MASLANSNKNLRKNNANLTLTLSENTKGRNTSQLTLWNQNYPVQNKDTTWKEIYTEISWKANQYNSPY